MTAVRTSPPCFSIISWMSSREIWSNDPVTQKDFPKIPLILSPSRHSCVGRNLVSGIWISSLEKSLSTISLFSTIYSTNARAVSGPISFTSRSSSSVSKKILCCIRHCEGRGNPCSEFSETWIATSFVTDTDSLLAMTERAISFAVFFPTFGIPRATRTRSSVVWLDFSIASRRLFTDFSLYPSS